MKKKKNLLDAMLLIGKIFFPFFLVSGVTTLIILQGETTYATITAVLGIFWIVEQLIKDKEKRKKARK